MHDHVAIGGPPNDPMVMVVPASPIGIVYFSLRSLASQLIKLGCTLLLGQVRNRLLPQFVWKSYLSFSFTNSDIHPITCDSIGDVAEVAGDSGGRAHQVFVKP
jgi:hypothetical protein